ncbi:hypothetical protein GCK32_000639 [Trichostrongylus colubriformis]|uniref:Uncharacterized protein n=1 Tax=Trichostrongylus colubriformis TaxID=6319 RepID=A0AAN8FID7_TRICO
MAPYSIMITGANRGIGLGFVREFLKNKEIRHIIATARDPKNAQSAQNSVSKTISVDVEPEHILVVSIHPGWVRTRMGGDDGEFSVEESVTAMVRSIAKLNKMHHGGYFSKTLEAMTY